MAKRSSSIGNLLLHTTTKLSDITNSDSHHPSLQQLLQEKVTLMQFIAERDKMIESNGAELRRLQTDIKKLRLQNRNLAQSNSFMLGELNLGRERIRKLQHEISCRSTLLKRKSTTDMQEKVEMDHNHEKNASLSQSHVPGIKEGDEKGGQPSPKACNDEQQSHMNRRRVRSRSIGSTIDSTQNASKDKVKDNNRRRLRRHSSATEPPAIFFETEDAIILSCSAVKDGAGESPTSRNETQRTSFGRPLRRAAEKVQTYKEIPINVKMRRLE